MREFVTHSEKSLSNTQHQLETRSSASTSLEDAMVDEFEVAFEILPRFSRYAQILLVYGAFEHTATALLRNIEARLKLSQSRFSGLPRLRSRFQEIGAGAEAFAEPWCQVDALRNVRNAIAHENGVVEQEDSTLMGIVEGDPLLSLNSNDNGILVANGFAAAMIQRVDDAISCLLRDSAHLLRGR